VLTRVLAIGDNGNTDSEYLHGLRVTSTAALDYAFLTLETGDDHSAQLPVALLAQARVAARRRVSIDIIIRRYVAGHALFRDFLAKEFTTMDSITVSDLHKVLRGQDVQFNVLLAKICEEHMDELTVTSETLNRRTIKYIEGLLDGELLDTTPLGYSLDGFHIGFIAVGPGAKSISRSIAVDFGWRLLLVDIDPQTVWAWHAGGTPPSTDTLNRLKTLQVPGRLSLAVGEPLDNRSGWIRSHHQAKAVLPIAMRHPGRVVRYADEFMLAPFLERDLHARSLQELFLAPLETRGQEKADLTDTLRAYFTSKRNISSTAAALGISRPTVTKRLRTVEDRLGRKLESISAELELALRLQALLDLPGF
jgi:hypothetical protein